jgi:adenosine/AMP kinase
LFTVQNARTSLVKIDHVCFCYLATKNPANALLTITHKKCALLKMAASEATASRFARVDEEEINQIIEDAITKSTKIQTSWSIAIFRGQ